VFATIWVVVTAWQILTASLTTNIVDKACVPWGLAVQKAIASVFFIVQYLLPVLLMIFCYSRIVHALINKVTCDRILVRIVILKF